MRSRVGRETGVTFAGVLGGPVETAIAFAGVLGARSETGIAFAGVDRPVLGGLSRALVSWVSCRPVFLAPSRSVSGAQQYAAWEFKDGMGHAPVRSSSCSVSLLCADGDQNLGDNLVDDA